VSQRIPLNQNRRVTGTTEILELCKDMLRLEHGIGNDFDMDTAEFTEFRAQFLADFAQIPLIIGIYGRRRSGRDACLLCLRLFRFCFLRLTERLYLHAATRTKLCLGL